MSFIRKTYQHGNVIEVIEYHTARQNAGGTQKHNPSKPTPERQKRYRMKLLELRVWRLLNENFNHQDSWVTFTFRKEYRPKTPEAAKRIIQGFVGALRRFYKKQGTTLKYICTCGIGEKGGYHFHMAINTCTYYQDIAMFWCKYASNGKYTNVKFEPLDGSGEYRKLASYFIKNGNEDFNKVKSIFGKRVTYSRNLIMPLEKKTIIKKKLGKSALKK